MKTALIYISRAILVFYVAFSFSLEFLHSHAPQLSETGSSTPSADLIIVDDCIVCSAMEFDLPAASSGETILHSDETLIAPFSTVLTNRVLSSSQPPRAPPFPA
ncbi:MAG: hypothetical protein ACNA78_08170 [Balneolaceae bacterium]